MQSKAKHCKSMQGNVKHGKTEPRHNAERNVSITKLAQALRYASTVSGRTSCVYGLNPGVLRCRSIRRDRRDKQKHGKDLERKMWKASTPDKTAEALLELARHHAHYLVHILPSFTSTDMTTGVDVAELIKNHIALGATKLDRRGMHFKQQDLEQAIKLYTMESILGICNSLSGKRIGGLNTWSRAERKIAKPLQKADTYLLRVEFSHIEGKLKAVNNLVGEASGTTHPGKLVSIYNCLDKLACGSTPKPEGRGLWAEEPV